MAASIPLIRPAADRFEGDSSKSSTTTSWKASLWRLVNAHWFRCAVLALAAVLVHSPALQGQRIWDDQYLAHDNPFIKSPILIPESFRHYLFLDSLSAHYRPVQNISFIWDYFFWNTDEFGFHLTNVLLHAASGILLYFLLRELFGSCFFRNLRPETRERAQRRSGWVAMGAFVVPLLWCVYPVAIG